MDALFWGQWKILERVAQGAPLPEVLESIVRLIEEGAHGMMCSILLFDPVRGTLHHGASPSLPEAFTRAINGFAIGPTAGSCGAAAFSRQPVIVEDTSEHSNWLPWRELAMRHRLRACWSTPILAPDNELLGTFAMYYHEPRRPSVVEEKLITTAKHLTSIAITLDRQARLQEQLRQAQRLEAVGKLASGVAHDFNNLLSVIVGYSAMLSDALPPGEPLRADVEEISRAASRAGELTRQLLAFGRQQMLKPRVLDLNRSVTTLEKMLGSVLRGNVVLQLALAPDLWRVQIDPGQLEQILLNLVVNARDAMPEGGRVEIRTANVDGGASGRYVCLSVSDSGAGMDAATRARVFEPFYTTKERGKGTGLGLSTVWGIVSQSGGHIEVASEPGLGATFQLYFPRVEAGLDAAQAVVQDSVTAAAVGGQETVLVVEDEPQVRSLLFSVLRRAGYTVLQASNGEEGLALSQTYLAPIHLLLTDVVMPRMSGPELAERLKPLRPDLRIIYLSGHTENAELRAELSTADAFVEKPVAPLPLLNKIREVLDAALSSRSP